MPGKGMTVALPRLTKYVQMTVSGFRFLGRTDAPGRACPQKALHPYTPIWTYFSPYSLLGQNSAHEDACPLRSVYLKINVVVLS